MKTLLTCSALALLLIGASALGKDQVGEKPWRVDAPLGPTRTIAFETDAGTWLHLDVHPDGRRIVFSLLGDLYLLPLEGGDAQRITSGPAYDVQPRFSPDGTQIAFASDRSGIENLWTCALDGSRARALTQEKEVTVSAPAWSPDGEYVVGRKRLTDASSIGAVELWLWHVKGGAGVRLTKSEEKPDAADPTFVPGSDGRFVYYAARQGRYEYDRNVNEGVWQIARLDRRDGKATALTGEFGGAAAPTFARDGKTLAFARRVRAKTRIELMDVASGRTRVLAEGVQRDNQEGFAFHGVFPGFAFTPDGKALIASADNKLWRFDAATGARSPIPFRARVEQTVTEALRTQRPAVADEVRARVLRWASLSPDGRTLAFQAFGQIWAMPAAGGAPRRIGTGSDLEIAPAFSSDGRELAYATWNDRDGGHVWRRPVSGGKAVRITDVPGQYANPAFSPDGSKIVFVRGSGATFRDHDLIDELWLEVRWVSRAGGASHYVATVANRGGDRRMPRPTFSPDGNRIYFIDDEPAEKPALPPRTALYSATLDGGDKRAHLRFTRAEEVAISPDARHVAFNEQHDAWVSPLPSASDAPVEIGLENGALPVARLSDEGGEWVAWARGGAAISFVRGPEVRVTRLADALRAPEPKPDEAAGESAKQAGETARAEGKAPLPKSAAIAVDLRLPRARPSGVVAYVGARIVTMRGDEVIERGALVVDGDRIATVGAESEVAIPAGARRIDLSGRTLIPGLFDEHAHLHYSTLDVHPQQPWKYNANLAYGVTSTHDVSATSHEVFAQSERVEAGLMTGPRVFSTGSVLYGADSPSRTLIESLDDARKTLRRMKAFGAFAVKSYMQPGRNQRQWIVQAAREEGMLVVPEGGGDLESDMTMILDGHTTIEHALPFAPLGPDVLQLFSRSGTAYTPTLLVAYGGLSGDRWFHQHYELWKDERLARFVPQSIIDTLGRIRSVMATDPADWHHLEVAASARDLLRAGALVNLGGHGQMQGLGPHWEMWAFVQAGMTPLEALRVATLNPAKTLGLDRDLGSLEPGKLADFAVLEKNPLERIEDSETVELVVKNGVAYTLDELARRPTETRADGSGQ